jgi:hypothetical protein
MNNRSQTEMSYFLEACLLSSEEMWWWRRKIREIRSANAKGLCAKELLTEFDRL